MKVLKPYIKALAFMLGIVAVVSWAACKKENTDPPIIKSVRVTDKDSSINAASLGNTIAILGENFGSVQNVYFNDVEAYVNPSYVKNDVILVQIPLTAPYRSNINKIKVVTLHGTAEYAFGLIQPAPVIESFSPSFGSTGDTVTIVGTDLDNIKTVDIGGRTVTPLAGSTDKLLKVKLTASDLQGFVTVTTVGGAGKSKATFGFTLILYDDALKSDWWAYEWAATRDMASTEQAKKGKSIKVAYTGGYAGFGMGSNTGLDVKQYKGVKFSVFFKSTATTGKIKFAIKDSGGGVNKFAKILDLVTGWNEFTLWFDKDLSNPDIFKEIQIQEWGNTPFPTIYIDDFGML